MIRPSRTVIRTFSTLGKSLSTHGRRFQAWLPTQYRSNRRDFLDAIKRLNGIRRMVMHPVRGASPSEDDFYFVRTFRLNLASSIATHHAKTR